LLYAQVISLRRTGNPRVYRILSIDLVTPSFRRVFSNEDVDNATIVQSNGSKEDDQTLKTYIAIHDR